MKSPLTDETTVGAPNNGRAPSSIPGTSFAIWEFSAPVNLSYCQLQPPQCLPEDPLDTLVTRLQRGKRRRQRENGPSETVESKSFSVRCFRSNPFTTRKSHVFTISWRGELIPSTWQSRERTPQGSSGLLRQDSMRQGYNGRPEVPSPCTPRLKEFESH